MFNEITYVVTTTDIPCEIMVDIDTDTKKPIDIYAYRYDIKDLPITMQPLFTVDGLNSLFVHANNLVSAYNLIKRHCTKIEDE